MENKTTISPSELKYIITNMSNLVRDNFALEKTFDKIFLNDNNLTYEQKRAVSQRFVKVAIEMIKSSRYDKDYYCDTLVSIQERYGNVANGNILYHFDTNDKKDIAVLLKIPAIRQMIRQNQIENLALPVCDRLPSALFPINTHDKKFMQEYNAQIKNNQANDFSGSV